MDLGLKDQVVVITGAGRGIGAQAALAFAREGAKVAVWDRDFDSAQAVSRNIQAMGNESIAIGGSVGVRQDVDAAIGEVLARFGAVHVLINNAGHNGDSPISEMSDALWESVINVTLTAPFMCIRAVAPTMIAQKYGRIVNIGSRTHLGEANKANYCAGKAGLLGLSRAVAIELGPHGITINTVAPGLVPTERIVAMAGYEGLSERAQTRQLVKRPASPMDIVNGMLFYASSTSGFVTGDLMYVTGGRLG